MPTLSQTISHSIGIVSNYFHGTATTLSSPLAEPLEQGELGEGRYGRFDLLRRARLGSDMLCNPSCPFLGSKKYRQVQPKGAAIYPEPIPTFRGQVRKRVSRRLISFSSLELVPVSSHLFYYIMFARTALRTSVRGFQSSARAQSAPSSSSASPLKKTLWQVWYEVSVLVTYRPLWTSLTSWTLSLRQSPSASCRTPLTHNTSLIFLYLQMSPLESPALARDGVSLLPKPIHAEADLALEQTSLT